MTVAKGNVSVRALPARVNQKLTQEDLVLKSCRSDAKSHTENDDFYAASVRKNYSKHGRKNERLLSNTKS
jgi:hypothetical protein